MIDVFYDIDGCLVDYDFKLNMRLEEMLGLIRIAKKKGIKLHMNSNRSIEGMLKFYKKFKFNGIIIGENGLVIYNPLKKKTEICKVKLINRRMLSNLLSKDGYAVHFINTEFLANPPQNIFKKFKSKSPVYFCEKTRKFTMTIYPRILRGKKLIFNHILLNQIQEKLKKAYKNHNISLDLKHGNVIMMPKGIEKGYFIKKIARYGKIASFGDTEFDISMFKVSDFCGAPKNAEEKVKEKVTELKGFISNKEYTQAAYEFLEKILERC